MYVLRGVYADIISVVIILYYILRKILIKKNKNKIINPRAWTVLLDIAILAYFIYCRYACNVVYNCIVYNMNKFNYFPPFKTTIFRLSVEHNVYVSYVYILLYV